MIRAVILGFVASATAALLVALAAWRPWRPARDDRPRAGAWGGVVACAAAWIVSYVMVNHRAPAIPPDERWQWLFFVGIGAGVLGLVHALLGGRRWGIPPLALLAGATMLVLPVPHAFAVAGVAVLAALVELLAARRPGPVLALGMAIAICGAAAVVMLSGNDRLSRLLAGFGIAAALLAIAGWPRPSVCPGPGSAAVLVALLVGTVLTSRFYSFSQVSVWSYLLACLAPLGLWLGEIPPVRRARPWIGVTVRLISVIVPAAVAVALAISVSETDIYFG